MLFRADITFRNCSPIAVSLFFGSCEMNTNNDMRRFYTGQQEIWFSCFHNAGSGCSRSQEWFSVLDFVVLQSIVL